MYILLIFTIVGALVVLTGTGDEISINVEIMKCLSMLRYSVLFCIGFIIKTFHVAEHVQV